MVQGISSYSDDYITYNHCWDKSPDDRNFHFHTHDICEIVFLKSGDVSAVIGTETYKLKKDSLVIFRANVLHRIKINSPVPYERYNFLFDEKVLANGVFNRLPQDLDLINCSGNTQITELFEKIDYYCSKFDAEDLKILVTNIVEDLLFSLYTEPWDDFNNNQISIHPIISSAVEFINSHYTEPITVDDVCKAACVTKSHLHHLFMNNMNISPKKYINMKRLSKAQKLISRSEKPTTVYTDCGFTDYGTFFRNYTKHFGYSPSQKDEIASERKIES